MEITIPVENVSGKLLLRQFVGNGNYGDQEIELSVALPSMSPVVEIGGQTFLISIHEIVQAVAAAALAGHEVTEE